MNHWIWVTHLLGILQDSIEHNKIVVIQQAQNHKCAINSKYVTASVKKNCTVIADSLNTN